MNIRPSMKKFASGAKMISDLGFRNSDLAGDYRLQAAGYRKGFSLLGFSHGGWWEGFENVKENRILNFRFLILDLGKRLCAPLSAISHILSPAPRLVGMVSLLGILSSGAWAQVTVTRTTSVGQAVPDKDKGYLLSSISIQNPGISVIQSVTATVNLSSADNSRPMVLGHHVSTLTHGSGAGAASVYLFNRPNSTASSLNGTYTFDSEFEEAVGDRLQATGGSAFRTRCSTRAIWGRRTGLPRGRTTRAERGRSA